MLQHAEFHDRDVENAKNTEPVKTIVACEDSVAQPVQPILATEELLERIQQLQHMYASYERKVILNDPRIKTKCSANEGSDYEGSDEMSPIQRKFMQRSGTKRPQSAKLPTTSTSRPNSAKEKQLHSSLKKNSTFLLDALLSSQGCPGPLIQAEALAASHQGQLSCLFRLSVFIWPVWLDPMVTSTHKLQPSSGVVLEMSHQEVIHQLNSLCQSQESGKHMGVGQSDATVHHMVTVCVKRCCELFYSRDFKTTKQILQKIFQLSRPIATTARNQIKLLPLKLIAAMLHVGDGNIRDAVFDLRSAIESIQLDQDNVKPLISTDVAILYNHLSYYYSLLGFRAEASKYIKMGIEIMAECRSVMARLDMSSHSLSIDEVSARHQYMHAVMLINQVVSEVSNENADLDAAKSTCSDAIMYLDEVQTSATCTAHLATRLKPLSENIQEVLNGKSPLGNHCEIPIHSGATLHSVDGSKFKDVKFKSMSSKGKVGLSKLNTGIHNIHKNLSAKAKDSKLDMSASFGVIPSQIQVASHKIPKTRAETPSSASRLSSGVRFKASSPNTNNMKTSKFKMLMLGPALANGKKNHPIPSLMDSTHSQNEKFNLPESLIRALFPSSYFSKNTTTTETTAINDPICPDKSELESNNDLRSNYVSEAACAVTIALSHQSEHHVSSIRMEYPSATSNIHLRSSNNAVKFFDIKSLRLCCSIVKSLTCCFDALEEASQQHMKLAAHCASKLACDTCYLLKLEEKSPGATEVTTWLSSGKYASAELAHGGIIATQMSRFLQNGALMKQVVIFDEDTFTEENDDFDREILPCNAEKYSIMMGVVPGYSKFNKISGFMVAIRSPQAPIFNPEEQLVCEILCECCSQALPLLLSKPIVQSCPRDAKI
jgi:hypothetical protein